MATFRADKETTVLAFILEKDASMKRSTLKTRLKHGAVTINGEVTTRHDAPLVPGDEVELHRRGAGIPKKSPKALKVVRQTNQWVVVEKPAGLLSVPTEAAGRQRTALSEAQKALGIKQPLYACHRLDKDTSGLLLLAMTTDVQQHFFDHWDDVQKGYVAVCDGRVDPTTGSIDVALYDHPESLMAVPSSGPDAKDALTKYKVSDRGPLRTMVDIELVTGRRHQIRSHFKHIGHPLCGDGRYGTGKQGAPRLCLHAALLSFVDPASSKRVEVRSKPPRLFHRVLQQKEDQQNG